MWGKKERRIRSEEEWDCNVGSEALTEHPGSYEAWGPVRAVSGGVTGSVFMLPLITH